MDSSDQVKHSPGILIISSLQKIIGESCSEDWIGWWLACKRSYRLRMYRSFFALTNVILPNYLIVVNLKKNR